MANLDNHTITQCHIIGTPPPWSITAVSGFVVGALQRLQRDGIELPERFWLSACPWGEERNAIGGTPETVQEITDPRLRMVHFTGCGRPYLVILFASDDAITHQQIARAHLPWSEHFVVTYTASLATLEYLGCTEDIYTDVDSTNQLTVKVLLKQMLLGDF